MFFSFSYTFPSRLTRDSIFNDGKENARDRHGPARRTGRLRRSCQAAGGETRLSTFVSGAFLLFLIVVLGSLVARIPMAALVAVMITFRCCLFARNR